MTKVYLSACLPRCCYRLRYYHRRYCLRCYLRYYHPDYFHRNCCYRYCLRYLCYCCHFQHYHSGSDPDYYLPADSDPVGSDQSCPADRQHYLPHAFVPDPADPVNSIYKSSSRKELRIYSNSSAVGCGSDSFYCTNGGIFY